MALSVCLFTHTKKGDEISRFYSIEKHKNKTGGDEIVDGAVRNAAVSAHHELKNELQLVEVVVSW